MKQSSHEASQNSIINLGFWIYLMTDLMVFASLFATFMILRHSTNGGPSANELFDMPYVLIETFVLLFSSLLSGVSFVAAKHRHYRQAISFLVLTLIFGAVFLGMELKEFAHMAAEGHSWASSAFLSSYFTLVGTHGFHIFVGLIWGTVLVLRLMAGAWNEHVLRKLGLFTVFWHFLELVWIFIFSVVYLIGGQL